MTKVITISSPKGGVGKTTLAICIANEIYRNNASVCVIYGEGNSCFDMNGKLREAQGLKKRFDAFSLISRGDISLFIKSGGYNYIIFDIESKDAYSSAHIFNKSDFVLVPLKSGCIECINTMPFLGYLSALIKSVPFAVIYNESNKSSKRIEGDVINKIKSVFKTCNVIEEPINDSICYKDMTFTGFALDEINYKYTKKISHILNIIIFLIGDGLKPIIKFKK